jgi:hypothetical protein
MELVNGTKHDLQATQGLDKTGQPWLIVIAKATYRFECDDTGRPVLADKQNKLIASDVFEAEPGLSTPFFESDYVPFKAACDVIVKASTYAPWGGGQPKPVAQLDVGLRVAASAADGGAVRLQKAIRVYGERQWRRRAGIAWQVTEPQPFTTMPITYGRAFGGTHTHEMIDSRNPADYCAHPGNLVGRGYAAGKFARLLDGAPAHQTELWTGGQVHTITNPEALHTPASLGPIARNWLPRRQLAGTYDQRWQDEVFPLLPEDFDERFYQCAPLDQQMPYPKGGEVIALANLTQAAAKDYAHTQGICSFKLPRLTLPMVVLPKNRRQIALTPVVDTIAIDADAGTYDITWRARTPLKRSLHEIHTVAAGSVCKRWWKSRVYGSEDCGCGGFETDDEDLAPVDVALDE